MRPRAVWPALTGLPAVIPFLVGLAVGAMIGLINGGLIAYTGIPPFIATLGAMVAARGFAKWLTKGQPIPGLADGFVAIGAARHARRRVPAIHPCQFYPLRGGGSWEESMKYHLLGLALLAASPAAAQDIGITLSNFDDVFFTSMREGMADEAAKTGASLQTEDARLDIGRQLSQVQNFIAQGVDAIIVNPVDATSTKPMTEAAIAAGIPLVYVNRDPVDGMPAGTWFVGSRDLEGGTLQAQEVCRLLGGKGRVSIIMGDLAYESARLRTQAVEDVLKTDECKGIEILEKQAGLWTRISGMDLMTNWLSTGQVPNAVISNNDEMAIGAIQAMQSVGQAVAATPADGAVIVAGFDATADALSEVGRGKMATTVFQDAYGQGAGSVEIATDVIKGEKPEQMVWIPYQLVTPQNYKDFVK